MRVIGIEALVPRRGTSKAAPGHKIKAIIWFVNYIIALLR
jgi:hypothetical protein